MPSSLFAATPAPTSLLSTAAPRRLRRLSTRRAAAAAAAAAMEEAVLLLRAAEVADLSAGLASPHPNFGCVVARSEKALGRGHGGGGGEGGGGGGGGGGMVEVVGEGFLYAQGTKCAELQSAEAAGELARGDVAYLNLEPGDCYADHTAVSSLVQAGISRVVVDLRHPLQHLRGKAIQALRTEGIQVNVIGEELQSKIFEVVEVSTSPSAPAKSIDALFSVGLIFRTCF